MKQAYEDIRSRIAEEPTWYDIYGVPRYGEVPEEMRPFIRGLGCQGCTRTFQVALVDEVYAWLWGRPYEVRLTGPCPHEQGASHAEIVFPGHFRTLNRETGEWDYHPVPDTWDYGDPPIHGCVGDTMTSVPDYDWETENDFRAGSDYRVKE